MRKKELNKKMLTEEQVNVVKEMIINSLRSTYTDQGSLPGDGFLQVAGMIADKIIKNTQVELMRIELGQNNAALDKAIKKKKK